MAWHLTHEIIPAIDYGIDFHTGGARINNFPQVRAQMDDPQNLDLASAFSTRFMLNSQLRDKSLRKEAVKMGKTFLVYEGGESLRLRKNAIDEGVSGALRVMRHLGMRDVAPEPRYKPTLIRSSTWIRAKSAGLHHSFVRAGDQVKKGMTVGLITGPFGEFELPVKCQKSGFVVAVNNNPVINRGDAILHLGLVE